MLNGLVMDSSPLVKLIVPVTEKLIVSPGAALAMAARKDRGPLSAVVVTLALSPGRGISVAANHRTKRAVCFMGYSEESVWRIVATESNLPICIPVECASVTSRPVWNQAA